MSQNCVFVKSPQVASFFGGGSWVSVGFINYYIYMPHPSDCVLIREAPTHSDTY